jgi:signal transduction histidine kinase
MAALHTSLPSANRTHPLASRRSLRQALERFSTRTGHFEGFARHRYAPLAATIAAIWGATLCVAAVSIDIALWVALALSLIAPLVVAGAYRGFAPAMLAAIPAIGIAIGVVAESASAGAGGWHGIIALAIGTSALVVAVAAMSEAVAHEHARAEQAWGLADERVQLSEEFVSFIAHEIRTPMTTIAGTADVLRRKLEALSPEQRREALTDIEDEVMRLSQLADELMAVARRSAGASGQLVSVPMAAIVDDTVRRHRRLLGGREIAVAIDDPEAVVTASPLLTSHVIANLLTNAEKYSPKGEPIEVRMTTHRATIDVEVLDRGAGIALSDASRIFSPFYRSGSAPSLADGHGVGLALSRRLMEVQGGHLWVEPRRDGPGSAFHVVMPAACP